MMAATETERHTTINTHDWLFFLKGDHTWGAVLGFVDEQDVVVVRQAGLWVLELPQLQVPWK